MNEKELPLEDKTITEQQYETEVAADAEAGPTCPLEPDKSWDDSVCGLIEQRVLEQVMQRLQAEQAPGEVSSPAAEIAGEEPELSAEP